VSESTGELSVNAEFGEPSELSAAKSVFVTIGAGTGTVPLLPHGNATDLNDASRTGLYLTVPGKLADLTVQLQHLATRYVDPSLTIIRCPITNLATLAFLS